MGYTEDGWLLFENGTVLTASVRLLLAVPISVYGILLLVAGSLGNFGLAYVLICDRRRLKMTTRVIFCLLAVADTTVLWIAVLRYCIRVTVGWDFRVAYPMVCPLHVFAVYVSTNLAVTVFCILCVDRCFVIYCSLEGYRTHFVGSNPHPAAPQTSQKTVINSIVLTHSRLTRHHSRHHSKCFLLSMRLFQCTRVRRMVNRLLCCINPCSCSCAKPDVATVRVKTSENNLYFNPINQTTSIRLSSFTTTQPQRSLLRLHQHDIMSYSRPRYSSPLENTSSSTVSCEEKTKTKPLCDRVFSIYTRHSCRWLTLGLILGSLLVVIKHLVAYRYVRVETVRGCCGTSLARWRDYTDFVTQAIIPYLIIIPANACVYRAIKRHQQMLTALRMSVSRGSTVPGPNKVKNDQIPICPFTSPYMNLINTRTKYTFAKLQDTETTVTSAISSTSSRTRHFSAKVMVATASHLSKNHLFIFKTLITLSVLHFVINLPGHLYAQVILPSLSDWWFSTVEGHLLYDTLFLISYTNNGASFFILLCTVRGFRLRVCSVFRRSCLGRLLIRVRGRLRDICSTRSSNAATNKTRSTIGDQFQGGCISDGRPKAVSIRSRQFCG